MHDKPLNQLQRIHDRVSKEQVWEDYAAEIEGHKQYLLSFQPGPSFYWILNVKEARLEMVSQDVKKVLGYDAETFDFPLMFELVHEEDKVHILNFEAAISKLFNTLHYRERFNYKLQYDYRILHANGKYIRILNQMIVLSYDTATQTILTFGVNADISHLKKDLKPVLSFVHLHDGPSWYDVDVKDIYKAEKSFFSPREKEVLRLMLEGHISKEICEKLNISKHTVDSHRKHLLEKTQSRSLPEMVKKAIVNGWI